MTTIPTTAIHNLNIRVQQSTQGENYVNVAPIERGVSSIAGGAFALLGVISDIRRRKPSVLGITLALIGAGIAYRGITGHCYIYQALGIDTTQERQSAESLRVEKVMTVNHSYDDLYHFWQDFDATNKAELPKTTPQGTIDISEQRKHELEAWREFKEMVNVHGGYINFDKAPNGRGTEIRVVFTYTPQFGKAGHMASKLTGQSPEQQVTEALRHFKEVLEAGEVPSTAGQPSGRP